MLGYAATGRKLDRLCQPLGQVVDDGYFLRGKKGGAGSYSANWLGVLNAFKDRLLGKRILRTPFIVQTDRFRLLKQRFDFVPVKHGIAYKSR